MNHPAITLNPFPVLPTEFGRYRILRLLGQGGMGAVYLAEDSQLDREVALKIPFFEAAQSQQRIHRFIREAKSAAVLHHPNICTVFDAGQIDGKPFITMALIAGTTLDQQIDSDVLMQESRAAEIARKIADALTHAHSKGTIHRDLKPDNIMIANSGEPVVMDFGLAKRASHQEAIEGKLTRHGAAIGTPCYMSPEQVKGESETIGPATDIYSLGVILFEMLTAKKPYSGPMIEVMGQILAAPVPPVREFRPDVDSSLDAICQKAMAKDPQNRFQSMAEFAEAIDDFLKPKPTQMVSVESTSPVSERVPASVPSISQYGQLEDIAASESQATIKRVRPKTTKKRIIIGATAILALVMMAWLVSVILRVETPNGTLLVEINDPIVEARIKNGKLILSGSDGKDRYTLSSIERDKKIDAGEYKIRVEGADGLLLDTSEFTLKKGDRVTVKVTMEQRAMANKKEEPKTPATQNSGAKLVQEIGDDRKTGLGMEPTERTEEFEYVFEGERRKGSRQAVALDIGNGEKMEFVRIRKGKFQMGAPDFEVDAKDFEKPQHEVEITADYYLGKYTVTQAQYRAIVNESPSQFKGDQLPVEMVSWNQAKTFCETLSTRLKRKAVLPSEAQWEYACRAGTTTPFNFGSKLNGDLANVNGADPYGTQIKGPNKNKTVIVGSYPANPWGLYDMHGNILQWCEDYFGSYLSLHDSRNPIQLKLQSNNRVFRGGCYGFKGGLCRSSYRGKAVPDHYGRVGFRVCLPVES